MIIGGGLAGLTAADEIHRAGHAVTVIEARPFVGGRTMSLRPEGLGEGVWFDVGATWHWEDQPRMRALASELGLEVFPQYRVGLVMVEPMPGAPPERAELPSPSPRELRFVGGAQQLCERLAARLPAGSVVLDTVAVSVEEGDAGLTVSVADEEGASRALPAAAVVVAIPPRLALQDLSFTPDLPDELTAVLRRTPTWMASALKCVAVYEAAFWREDGLAGAAVSEVGPLREVHDAGTHDGTAAALWGFVSPRHEWRDLSFDDRLEQVFAHLGRLFGATAADPIRYFERDWSGDPYTNDETFYAGGEVLAYGDAAFEHPLMGGRLVWAGTETATPADGGGHMEGAVASGQRAAREVLRALRR
ncbi:MAG: flavin monoamine oxidase family protein [Acidimicrobiales bacterium]